MKGKAKLTIEMWPQNLARVASLAFELKNLSPHSQLCQSLHFNFFTLRPTMSRNMCKGCVKIPTIIPKSLQ